MTVTVDTNVLVYASNADSREHAKAQEVVLGILAGPDLTTVFWPVLQSYLRIVTHPGIFDSPLCVAEAHRAVEEMVNAPSVRVVGEGDQFWRCYLRVGGGRGNDVPDAVIVALMHEYGVGTILSRDRDFRRYDDITVRDPFGD